MRWKLTTAIRGTVLACAAIAAAAGSVGPARAQAPLTQVVSDPNGRFVMSFPADWKVVTRARGMNALDGTGPAKGGRGPAVNVAVASLGEFMMPQAYAAQFEELAKATLRHYSVVRESPVTVNGHPAYYRYVTGTTVAGAPVYEIQVFFTENQTGFVVTGRTVNDRARVLQDMPLITRIIGTFRVGSVLN
jgi:hypothetical protein